MKGTTHALVGGLAGALAGHPGWGLAAGMVSHALLDVVPHRDSDAPLHLVADACGALAALALAVTVGDMSTMAGMIGGVIPDVENVPEVVFKHKGGLRVFPSHWWRHDKTAGRGWLTVELAILVAAALGLAAVLCRMRPHGMLTWN